MSRTTIVLAAIAALLVSGCATTNTPASAIPERLQLGVAKFEYGVAHKALDRAEWIVGIPGRIFVYFGAKERSRVPSPETSDRIADYLEHNQLADTAIYVHHYDPVGQFRRLQANDRMSPVWRYSLGTMSVVSYTIMPCRVFGMNTYNPYTNSLQVNSDDAVAILEQAAQAKDVYSHAQPGTYAAVTSLPFISLYPSRKAVVEVREYAKQDRDWELELAAYRDLYPSYASNVTTSIASPFVPVWWAKPVIGIAGSAVGSHVGRKEALRRAEELHGTEYAQLAQPLPSIAHDELLPAGKFEEQQVGFDGVMDGDALYRNPKR